MRIIVWHGSERVAEHDYPDAGGPDVHVDPYLHLIGAWAEPVRSTPPTPVPYARPDGTPVQLAQDGVLHLVPGRDV